MRNRELNPLYERWWDNIWARANELGLVTQEQLAATLEVRQSMVSKWKTGAQVPNDTQKLHIARVLETTTVELFPLEEMAS